MEVTVNGKPSMSGAIVEQRKGAWTVRLDVDEEKTPLTGQVVIKVGDATFNGTVVHGDIPEGKGHWIGEIVGGNGGLEKSLPAKYYSTATLRTIVQDALAGAGEVLSSSESDSAALLRLQARWSRHLGRARLALTAVAREVGGFWRVNRAGQVLLRKEETWQAVPKFDFTYIDSDPSDGEIEISPETTPGAMPGYTLDGHKIAAVRTTWSSTGVRQKITIESESGAPRALGAVFDQAIRNATEGPINYSQYYPAKVIKQDPDGTLHILPDDARVRGNGLTKIPMRHGIPGLKVNVQLGSNVRLFFEDGDPKKPACALWEDGSSVLSVELTATQTLKITALQGITLVSPSIKAGPTDNPTQSNVNGEFLLAYIDGINNAIVAALGAITPGPATGGGGPAIGVFQGIIAGLESLKQTILSQFIKVQ